MEIVTLKYGNTNTYFINGLLVDTDMAGTMPLLWRELKAHGIAPGDIRYVFATHYHPDHMGLIGELTASGTTLLLPEHQVAFVHSSDAIFARTKSAGFVPIDERRATVFPCAESRAFLSERGIAGEIVPTKSHSDDGAALILDDGNAFVGDLEPREFIDGYDDNAALRADWENIIRHKAHTVHYGHMNTQTLG